MYTKLNIEKCEAIDQLSLLKGQSKKHSGSIPRNACVACET